MHTDSIVEEVHRIRQEMLQEFGGDVDALVDDCNRRVLSGEFGEFKVLTRTPKPAGYDLRPQAASASNRGWRGMEYSGIESAALQLAPKQRSRLIEQLMDSLDGEEDGGRWIDVRVEQAWLTEIQRRSDAFDRGEVTSIEHEEVMERLRAQLGHSGEGRL